MEHSRVPDTLDSDIPLATLPESLPSPPAGPTRPSFRRVRVGMIIGERYRITGVCGHGSMSRVYAAEQLGVGRPVALKLIHHSALLQPDVVARFEQEAQLLARVTHPNILSIFDIGKTEAGQPYIVMELVDGPSLLQLVRDSKRLDPARAVSLLLQIARALATVHSRGVIHRDLKPGNVLVVRKRSGVEVVKIGDFGLAKAVNDRAGRDYETRAGTVLGTPEYMSPEQVRAAAVDHRADIYSLGCMAYEMLTGSPPFVGEELATLYKQLHEEPVKLSIACPNAEIPQSLQKFIDRAMAKRPVDRYSNALEAYAALLRAADDAGISRSKLNLVESLVDDVTYSRADAGKGADSPPPRAHRRTRLIAGLSVAVAATLVLTAGVALGRFRGGGAAPDAPPELLLINSRPAGATVMIDGEPLAETTPTAVRGLAAGSHEIRLVKSGYSDVRRPVEVAAGARQSVDIRLPPMSRELTINTVPAGALVFVDSKLISASTPATLTVMSDEFHQIRIEKTGFEPRKINITPDDTDSALTVTLDLERHPVGNLWVDSNSAAEVWIDGMYTGFTTPTAGLRVPVGEHDVELRDSSGARSRATPIRIRHGESRHITLNLDSSEGRTACAPH